MRKPETDKRRVTGRKKKRGNFSALFFSPSYKKDSTKEVFQYQDKLFKELLKMPNILKATCIFYFNDTIKIKIYI